MPTVNEGPSNKDKTIMNLANEHKNATVTCGVQRKVNIGDFESIDVYCAATIPVELDDPKDKAELEEKLTAAMEDLIYIASKETAEKYQVIKNQSRR